MSRTLPKTGFAEAIQAAAASPRPPCSSWATASQTEGEQRDRASLDLPGVQEDLIRAIAETGIPLAVVLINGSAITMGGWIEQVPAILEAWYPGEQGGQAIAEALFGDANPGGKLPVTFPAPPASSRCTTTTSPAGASRVMPTSRARRPSPSATA